jgi:hypothetical protein
MGSLQLQMDKKAKGFPSLSLSSGSGKFRQIAVIRKIKPPKTGGSQRFGGE